MFVAEHLKHHSAKTNTLVSTNVAKLSSKFFRCSLSLPLILLRYIVVAPTRCVLIMFILTSSFLLFSILFQNFADFLFVLLVALFNAKGENNNKKIASSLKLFWCECISVFPLFYPTLNGNSCGFNFIDFLSGNCASHWLFIIMQSFWHSVKNGWSSLDIWLFVHQVISF